MPVSLFGRFEKVDIYGILLPGFYMFSSVYVAWEACTGGLPSQALGRAVDASESWVNWVITLFGSYLLGSVPRAFVVGPTDMRCNKICRKFRRSARERESEKWTDVVRNAESFPYVTVLRKCLEELGKYESKAAKLVSIPDEERSGAVAAFDYWKLVLCVHAPAAFAVAEFHEARVRFFVGMLWAGLLGLLCAIITLLSCLTASGWATQGISLLVVSAFTFVIFGMRLRFVRSEEATQVLLAYLAYRATGSAATLRKWKMRQNQPRC